jgi:peptide/nickel transport system ATP-binding protein
MMALLEVQGLTKHFDLSGDILGRLLHGQKVLKAVDGISFAINEGETVGLVGESGCGKSTTARLITRLIAATAGQVHFLGKDILTLPATQVREIRRDIQMVFQDPFASLNPRLSIGQIIAEGMQTLTPLLLAEQDAAVTRLLEQVGLDPAVASRYPHEFSGGQRQRIAIARALAVQPEVLVCDEPTSALDVSVQAQILNLLRDLQDQLGLAYLFVTHNFAVVEQLADRVAVMYLGRIVEEGLAEEVLQRPRHPYTQALLAAVPQPSLTPAGEERRPLGGEMPSPLTPPVGCHFHPRCPLAAEACRANYPATVPLTATHRVACIYALD